MRTISKSTDSRWKDIIDEVIVVREALFYEELNDNTIRCTLCPHRCVLEDGKKGICGVRMNRGGVLYTLNYGELTSIAMDPIEKKPLFHFYPGTEILSISTWGCNMKCKFCQNWEISQQRPAVRRVDPERIVRIAMEHGSKFIAYTYNEPIVWFEFVLDTSRLAAKEGIRNVLITNGFIEPEPLKLLLQTTHAVNIDLKGFNEEFYRKECLGELEAVKRSIEMVYEAGVHLEITTLIVPNGNDNVNELEEEFKWIASIDPDIPLHISRYFPNYKYTEPPTPKEKLISIYERAREHLNFVYIGNLWDEKYENTYCPDCGELLIRRVGYDVELVGIDEEGRCKRCERKILKHL